MGDQRGVLFGQQVAGIGLAPQLYRGTKTGQVNRVFGQQFL